MTGDGGTLPSGKSVVARVAGGFVLVGLAVALAACSASPKPKSGVRQTAQTKEYFPESVYGVKASPRVSNLRTRLPRGGGRDQVGRPYKVKGQWYHPKEQPNYVNTGGASWYGDAFHGRLTANGEVYDMTHLTAAHPTMPLPSYARVTNTKNGNSVVVRVNDRGPFAKGRIIDLSKRAAEMLDYTHAGVAQVKVEYMGRAPLHGQDDNFLMASFRPGSGSSPTAPVRDEIAPGVMVAMAGATPSGQVSRAPVFPGQPQSASPVPDASVGATTFGDPVLPDLGPTIPERPGYGLADGGGTGAVLGYAPDRDGLAAFATQHRLTAESVASSWKRMRPGARLADETLLVAVGTYATRAEAEGMASRIASRSASVAIEPDQDRVWFTVQISAADAVDADDALKAAWAAGATDAIVVRP